MILFMTGAAGFIGTKLLEKLESDSRADKIMCMVRDPKTAAKLARFSKVTVVECTLENSAALKLPEKADKAVHLAGFWKKEDRRLLDRINLEGTRNVLEMCRLNAIPEIIFTSTINVKLIHRGGYAESKLAAEQAVASSGLRYKILRPTAVYGPGDSAISRLAGMIHKGKPIPVFGNGKALEQPIFVGELVECLCEAIFGGAPDGIYETGGSAAMEYDEMLRQIGKAVGKPDVRIVHLPAKFFATGAKMLEILHLPSPLTREQVYHIAEDLIVDDDRTLLQHNVNLKPFLENLLSYLKPTA